MDKHQNFTKEDLDSAIDCKVKIVTYKDCGALCPVFIMPDGKCMTFISIKEPYSGINYTGGGCSHCDAELQEKLSSTIPADQYTLVDASELSTNLETLGASEHDE